MKLGLIVLLMVALSGGYYYYTSRPGPAEQAGAVFDEALDKTKRIIDIVKE